MSDETAEGRYAISPAGVTQDLGMPPAQPAEPPMSFAEATSRKAEFFADKAKMDSLMQGGVEATEEWRRITEGLSAQPETPTGPREAETEYLNEISGYNLPEDVLREFKENRPVSPAERRHALAHFEEMKNDPGFFARLQRGEVKAKVRWAALQSVLSRPVRDPQT